MSSSVIHVVAACLLDNKDRLLLVRKRGTPLFMMPGGKPEVGESILDALARELYEELGWHCPLKGMQSLGRFSAPAANEADATVTADVFWCRIDHDCDISPRAEIEELMRVPLDDMTGVPLAPLQHALLPAFRKAYRYHR